MTTQLKHFSSYQQRWAVRYFGLLVRCPADYRNVSGLEKIADQRQRTTEFELPLLRCSDFLFNPKPHGSGPICPHFFQRPISQKGLKQKNPQKLAIPRKMSAE
jgi:hypothetical protein